MLECSAFGSAELQNLDGNPDKTGDVVPDNTAGRFFRVGHHSADKTLDAQFRQGLFQKVADTAVRVSGEENKDPVGPVDQTAHAVLEKINGKVQIFFRKIDSFFGAACSGTFQCDDPFHFALRYAQKFGGMANDLPRISKGQILKILKTTNLVRVDLLQMFPVKSAVFLRIAHGLPNEVKLIFLKKLSAW